MLYADVCVNTPLGRRVTTGPAEDAEYDPLGQTFTYSVPEQLAGRLQPGHLVWVPFRGRRLQAVVLHLSATPPEFDTRSLISLVWAQPLLTPAQLALAHWISTYYLSPLIEALRLMLPAGLARRGRTVFTYTAGVPVDHIPGLTPTQAALLARIAQAEGTWTEVAQGLRGVTQKADLEPLIARGLVERTVSFPTPPPRPKFDRQVRLLVDREAIARALPTLGRASKQADVLVYLWQHSSVSSADVALDELCAAVKCTPAPVKALAEKGWVRLTPSAGRREKPRVALNLPAEAVPEAIVTLRGAEKHRAVLEALAGHDGPAWIGWVYAETGADLSTLRDLEAAGLITVAEEMVWRDPLAGREFVLDHPPVLTENQERVWQVISRTVAQAPLPGADGLLQPDRGPAPRPILLHGVTGSGKTEIYLRAIAEVLKRGQQAVVLVPEIALTPQTIRRFAARFPGQVTIWHSELGDGERFDIWRRVRTNHPAAQVVVGSRSALFLPFPSLGLIVVDEEHETAYKQERTPRYHARTVAIELGRICGALVLLGSATPALETYYAARQGQIELLTLPTRILGGRDWPGAVAVAQETARPDGEYPLPLETAELPPVEIVDMRQELRAGNRSMFSRALSAALAAVLATGQQAILYLNRRGTATFVLCRDCGHVETCPHCAIPLAYHGSDERLVCHHCGRRYPVPIKCEKCGSRRIRHFGVGTERVEEAVKLEFPQARTLRWDRDVTGSKGAHDIILERFVAHEADVLIGTQMIAKGLDLPLVTLVGVIAADTGLFLPDFRCGERTFQLLTQVAGRAGRSALGGKVIIQTYHPDHYAIVAASHHDYESFYRQEMAFRREQGYPPVRRLARLVYHHTRRDKAQMEAMHMAQQLRDEIARLASTPATSSCSSAPMPLATETDLIGPCPCFFSRERGYYRWQIILRSPDPALVLRHLSLPLGWTLDIDPVDLL